MMKRTWIGVFTLAVVTTVVATPVSAQNAEAGRRLHASLDGKSEVPGPGDLGAFGTAILSVNLGQERVCFDIQVAGGEVTGAHIHRGAAGEAGDVVVNLTGASNGELAGCAEVSKDLINELLTAPGGFYVNVHTDEFKAGAIRGQLSRQG